MTLLAVERIKLFSTRSPWWSMAIAALITIGFGLIPALVNNRSEPVSVETTQIGFMFGLMVMMVMAALAVTTEYRFGTIRTTFQAVPNRTAALLAKTVVVAVLAAVVGELAAFGAWAANLVVRPEADLAIDVADEWRRIAGAGLVYLLAAVLAVAVGILVRQSAGAITLLMVHILLLESLIAEIPGIGDDLNRWMPFVNAYNFISTSDSMPKEQVLERAAFLPWSSLAYFAAIAVGLLVVSLVVANRRDA